MTSAVGQEPLLVEQRERIMATDVSLHLAVAPEEAARAHVALVRGSPEALQAVECAWKYTVASGPQLLTDRGVALLLVLGSGEVITAANLEDYLATCAGGGRLWILPARASR